MKKINIINKNTIYKIQHGLLYEATLGVMAVLSVLLLGYELLIQTSQKEHTIILNFDFAVACIFLTDFTIGFFNSNDRDKYAKQNWLNLVSSVPVSADFTRSLRLLRVVRTVRIIRALALVSNFQRAKRAIKDFLS